MAASAAPLRRGKTVEQIYQKKTQLEHILLRPDTYVGSTEPQQQEMWVLDQELGEIVNKRISFVPALYKIFDEILVNAADNMMRDPRGMDLIEVTIDERRGAVSIMNNGKGIPVQVHKEHQCYVPELIFGHLLTSDNYDDSEKKVTGGRNGYGAKLTNIFSTRFVIETADKKAKKKYSQVFENNMTKKHPPQVSDYEGKEYTRVTFHPDLRRFGMQALDADITGLMMKRVYDVAGSTDRRCQVVLNGKRLPIGTFPEYVRLYLGRAQDQAAPCIHERVNERWEVAVSVTDGVFQQVSFVNSINTVKGGTHVTHVAEQLVDAILKTVKSKNRGGMDIKPAMVRNHLWVFVNCLIENPAFDSQTKETLTTKQSKFGSTCDISEKTIKQVLKSGVVELILDWVKAKEKVDLGRQLKAGRGNASRVTGIPKLDDANLAGGKHSQECTLILTEGDSAKSLAVAGLGVIGRDRYGVFPLKGKVLNVRDASYKQVTGNTEVQSLLQILGLDLKREYSSLQELRYGSVMLMTDQDHDGSHIKGLLINLVHHWWPSLLKLGFLKEFVTPIVKVWKEGRKDGERREERSFFTMTEYEQWRRQRQEERGWKTKYYKGLGTSTMKEAKEYFRQLRIHEIKFKWRSEDDGEAIDLAFNKKRADDRKDWINGYQEGTHVDHSERVLGYGDFVHKELVQFAKYDVMRSIPCMVDGFKPSQRKVIFCAFKKHLKSDIKVAQFVGYISEQSAYHHGEMSLENTIVNLAQTFVGSNNLNLLVPSGQFGTRLQGGKDHAAARYIYTRLAPATRLLFHPDDDHILEYLDEEGQRIEPKWYCPIIPTVLVNGAEGIGVGWSTSVPNYNPRDTIRNIRRLLRCLPMEEMLPWYRGFRGSIAPIEQEPSKLEVTGLAEKKSATLLEITELPVKVWTLNYKEFLEELMSQDKKKADSDSHATIEDFREYHTEHSVHFEVKLSSDRMAKVESHGFEKAFKLRTSISTSNMMLFDHEGKITRYTSALEILTDFCVLRRAMYVKRKAYLVGKLTREKEILSNKARFILMVVQGELELRRRKKAELLQELRRLGFKPMSQLNALMKSSLADPQAPAADGAEQASDEGERSDYGYLLGMPLWSLTFEKVEEIRKQLEEKKVELQTLIATTVEQIWDRDLVTLSAALDQLDAEDAAEALGAASSAAGRGRRKPAAVAARGAAAGGAAAGARQKSPEDASFDATPVRDCEATLRDLASAFSRERAAGGPPAAAAPSRQAQAPGVPAGGAGRAVAARGGTGQRVPRQAGPGPPEGGTVGHGVDEDDCMMVDVVDLEPEDSVGSASASAPLAAAAPPAPPGRADAGRPLGLLGLINHGPRRLLEPTSSCESLDRVSSLPGGDWGPLHPEDARESRARPRQATLFDSFPVHGHEAGGASSSRRGAAGEAGAPSAGGQPPAPARMPFSSGFSAPFHEAPSASSTAAPLGEGALGAGAWPPPRSPNAGPRLGGHSGGGVSLCDSPVEIVGDDEDSQQSRRKRRRRHVPADDGDEVESERRCHVSAADDDEVLADDGEVELVGSGWG